MAYGIAQPNMELLNKYHNFLHYHSRTRQLFSGRRSVTMMMIATAVAICDEYLDQQELGLLDNAHGLGLSQTDTRNIGSPTLYSRTYQFINQSS